MHSLFLMNCYFQSCTFNMLSIGGAVIPSDPVDQLPRLFSNLDLWSTSQTRHSTFTPFVVRRYRDTIGYRGWHLAKYSWWYLCSIASRSWLSRVIPLSPFPMTCLSCHPASVGPPRVIPLSPPWRVHRSESNEGDTSDSPRCYNHTVTRPCYWDHWWLVVRRVDSRETVLLA